MLAKSIDDVRRILVKHGLFSDDQLATVRIAEVPEQWIGAGKPAEKGALAILLDPPSNLSAAVIAEKWGEPELVAWNYLVRGLAERGVVLTSQGNPPDGVFAYSANDCGWLAGQGFDATDSKPILKAVTRLSSALPRST